MRKHRFLIVLAAAVATLFPTMSSAQVDQPQQQQQSPAGGTAAPGSPPAAPAAQPPPARTAPAPGPTPVVAPPVLDVEPKLKALVRRMDAVEKAVNAAKERDDELGRLRGDVEGLMYESTQLAEELRPRLAEARGQIQKLGAPPKADATPEAPAVVAERARLAALQASLDGAVKTSELTWVRARQLIERITDLRHAIFARNIFQRIQSPLSIGLWRDLAQEFNSVLNTLSYVGSSWIEIAAPKSATVLAIVLLSLVLYLALRQTFRLFVAARKRQRVTPPTFFERATAVMWFAPMRAAAPVFSMMLLYVGLDSLDILQFWADRVLWAIVKAVLIFGAIAAIIASVLAPGEQAWRLVPLTDRAAARISGYLQGIAGVFAADLALAEISRWLTLPVAVNVFETLIANLMMASLFMCVLLTPFAPTGSEGTRVSRWFPIWLKAPVWIVTLAVIAFSFLGYIALGRFIAHQLILTGVVVAVTGLLYLAIRALTRETEEAGLPVGELLEQRFGLQTTQRQTLARLTELALTLLLVMLAVPFILLQWGFSGADIRDWFTSLFFGFEVGQFKISLANIVIGILLFVALVLVTRLVQRWIKDVMLVPSRLDVGIANSIETVVGYLGTGIAGIIALSYAGFDVTNLALVAGALSVGIGFGLQSIVNNFVSGLILLFERPIKVGDWIVTGSDEGYVRKISVRSTEIETFDRANVVIPNADLITGRVKNWTLRDQIGRVRVPVGISYSADPDAARALMLKVADDNPNVLKFPAPSAQFDSFADSSVNLVLNAYVGEVTKGITVRTELAFGILKAFRDAQVEIPYPQHDIRLRDLEPFRHALQAAMEERLRNSRAAAENKAE